MPRIGRTRRLPHGYSPQKSTPDRHPSTKIPNKISESHRFVRIHHKSKTKPGVPSKTQTQDGATPVMTSQTAKPAYRKHKILLEKNGHLDSEVTAIPNPTPDTGFRPVPTPAHVSSTILTAPPSPTVHSVPLSKTGLPSASLPVLSPFTSLDPNSVGPSPTTSASTSSYEGPDSSSAGAAETHQASQSRKLSIPIIVLLAVGSALVVIGVFALIKYYSRPTRRPRPKPSRPILDDPFADDKRFSADESPIFGGKERMSPRPGINGGMWSWSQYPQPGTVITKPDQAAKAESTSGGLSHGYGAVTRSPRPLQGKASYSGRSGKAQYQFSGHSHTQSVPITTLEDSPYQASLHQVQGALSRTASRISAASISLYPSSPQISHANVGLAITRSPMTAFTADGTSVLKRTEPKAALARNRSDSVAEAARRPISKTNSYSEDSTYEGSDIGSPSVLPYRVSHAPLAPAHGGRSKIKSSYYTPGSYPRAPNGADKPGDSGLQHQPLARKSESRRDRDTQALTYALGLSSPTATEYAPPSPNPTLYPEDSVSVVEVKRPRKPSHKKKASDKDGQPTLPVIATTMDASAALGSLMLMDFGGQATHVDEPSMKRMSRTALRKPVEMEDVRSNLPSARVGGGSQLNRSMSRSGDKPPSIPLPAPLPSLTQMGLEHANPQVYADYRSPTYSMYGLYRAGN